MRPEEASRLHPLLTTALSSASEGLSNNVAPAHAAEAAQRRESAELDVDAGADATPSSSLSGSTSSGDLTPCLLISDSCDSDSAAGSSAAAISCHSLTTQTSVPLTEPSQHQPTLGSSSPSSGSAVVSVVFNISPIKLHLTVSSVTPAPPPAPACRESPEAKAVATNTPAATATASAGCQATVQAQTLAVDASTDTTVMMTVTPTSRILGPIRPTRIPASPRDSTAAPSPPSPAAAAPPSSGDAPASAHLMAPAPASEVAITPSSASRAALELLMQRRALTPPAPAGLLLPSPAMPQTANITPAALDLSLCCTPPPPASAGCGVCGKAGARAEAQAAATRAHAQHELEAAFRVHSASEARLQRQIESLTQQLAESRREAEALSRADAARRAAEAAALALGEPSSPILDQLAAAKTGGRVSSFFQLCGDGAAQADCAAAAEVLAALQNTLSFAQDVVAGGALLVDRAPCGSTQEEEEARHWLAAGSCGRNNTLSMVKCSAAQSLEASTLSADVSNSSGKVESGGSVVVLHTPLRTRSSRAINSSGTSAAASSGAACISGASSGLSRGPCAATNSGSGSGAGAAGGVGGPAQSPVPEERLKGARKPCAPFLRRALSLGSSQPAVPREAPIEVAATLPAGGFDTVRWGRCISELGAQAASRVAACDEGTQTECTSHGRGGSGRVEVGWLGARLSVASSSLGAVPL
jgi:hypothetical protein